MYISRSIVLLSTIYSSHMDSPTPVSQTFIHRDLKFVPNNFMAPLSKTPFSDGFHVVQDFLASSPLGFALTHPTTGFGKINSANLGINSSIAENGDIVFTTCCQHICNHKGCYCECTSIS